MPMPCHLGKLKLRFSRLLGYNKALILPIRQAMNNRFDSICFVCGSSVFKNKGHFEKTNHSHVKRGIEGNWVTRCKHCVGSMGIPNNMRRVLQQIVSPALTDTHYSIDVWFNSKRQGIARITLNDKLWGQARFTTILSSNTPDKQEISEKMLAFTQLFTRFQQQQMGQQRQA